MEGTVRLFNGEAWIDAVKGDRLRAWPISTLWTLDPDASGD